MEPILWRSPLVYKDSELSQNPNCEITPKQDIAQGVLTSAALKIQIKGTVVKTVPLSIAIGAEILSGQSWRLHTYPIDRGNYIYCPMTFECEDAAACQQWVQTVRLALGQTQPRSLMVLINPESGQRKGHQSWAGVEPILRQANWELQVQTTQNAEDLQQQVQNLALDTYAGLVILGGDGSIFYAVNGLMQHRDRDRTLKLPLGFIPTGTSNGLVKSILDANGLIYSTQNMAVAIAKGGTGPLDLIQVTQQQTYFSVLSLSWGFFSDVDIESDRIKGLGFLKNYLYTLLRLISFRRYSGVVKLKMQDNWQTFSDQFLTLWTLNVPWASYNFKPAPNARLHDAKVDVWITRAGISRWQFIKILLKAFTGQHLGMAGVDYYKAQALQVIPDSVTGRFAIDGEAIPDSPVTLELYPQPLTIFVPLQPQSSSQSLNTVESSRQL